MNADPQYVSGNASDGGIWHKAKRRESRGAVTGKLIKVYWVAACSGRQLGGPWGSTNAQELPASAVLCRRCARLTVPAPAQP